ncbi:phosphoribosylamine--glycine ligase [Longirhabdus pacifica]|uniref:phosphoribosylamine--glycine ligase n=1 Tax=Longirhabdus pacifica TaxID=2305227 RepID=UPI001008DAAE|nr:phosphoribosylamine--glycine ligase [Longirhabdus pacifica]
MNVLVIGRGGREHTIIWSLKKSAKVNQVYCAPGNAGISQMATCIPYDELQFDALCKFAKENAIDLVIVGPEEPLFRGAVDAFEAAGIPAFGPNKDAAIIEGSKAFSKSLMKKYDIPTAQFAAFTEYEAALDYLHKQKAPIVIKADGLAAGKGVTVAQTMEEAEEALKQMMVEKSFGEAGNEVVIEECLFGQEMSILAFVDGETVRPMVPSQDHKPIFDGDKGPNTGGMGTYSPVPHIGQDVVDEAIQKVLIPAAKAMVAEGRHFKGVLYAGLMMTESGVKTIEFNCRFGDPETQVVLPRLESELVDVFQAVVEGTLHEVEMKWSEDAAVCVVLASEGYPGAYPKGKHIKGLDNVKDAVVFHAGTKWNEEQMTTAGGRVLGVTAKGATLAEAQQNAYKSLEHIHFDGMQFRKDIADKALLALK